jgi:hypothetical protein
MSVDLSNIGFHLDVPDLPEIHIAPLRIGIDPLQINPLKLTLDPLKISVDPLKIELAPIELKPVDISIRLKEFPSIRVHLPVDYRVGFALLGHELMSVRLCGQGQVITEPYVPNPCECRPGRAGATLAAVTDTANAGQVAHA